MVPLAFPPHFHPSNRFLFSLAGLFIVSLVSNATPFLGASYTLVATAELMSFGFSADAFVIVVGITAAGAAMGKLLIYGGAKGFKRQLSGNKNVRLLAGWAQRRRFLLAVFVTALIPLLPLDDYIYIGAAAAKTRLASLISVTVAAKLIKSAAEIGLEFLGLLKVATLAGRFLGVSSLEFSYVLTVALLIFGVFLFEFDWGRFLPPAFVSRYSSPQLNDPSPDR